MVEGHQCHRLGHFHRKKLLGKSFTCSSPNGRFTEGAKAITGQPLSRIEVHGKNLFYFFGNGPEEEIICVHFHFGMSGAFSLNSVGEATVQAKPTTRLQIVNEELGIVGHLSAMTLQYGTIELYKDKIRKLGEDPLRSDADAEKVWAQITSSKKSIGYILMDQSIIAGIGNIYRAEILFKSGVHPEQIGMTLTRDQFDRIWFHSVDLLKRGFQAGSIITVDSEEGLPPPWTRRYIYNQSSCGRCGGRIKSWDISGRTAYACTTCQLLPTNGLPAGRKSVVKNASKATIFVSHCAPDDEGVRLLSPQKMTVAQLKNQLAASGLSTTGRKDVLVQRLLEANKMPTVKEEEVGSDDQITKGAVETPEVAESRGKKRSRLAHVKSHDAQLLDFKSDGGEEKQVASAKEAALEKLRAGETRNVEHVPMGIYDATNN